MKLIVKEQVILNNIAKARSISNKPIAIMVKDFYEGIFERLSLTDFTVFSRNRKGSVCNTIGMYDCCIHKGAVLCDCISNRSEMLLNRLYVPINAHDNREGLDLESAIKQLKASCEIISDNILLRAEKYIMITSGCINDKAPSLEEIELMWDEYFSGMCSGVSVGGSYYLQYEDMLPECVKEVRIGEYALFGTIPYCNDVALFGEPAISVETKVLQVYKDRRQILVDGGYSTIDSQNCKVVSKGGLIFSAISSDYTIYDDPFGLYSVGDTVVLIPDYYSLVKLRNVERVHSI